MANMNHPIDRILNSYPAMFFQVLIEQMDAAFAEAIRLTDQHVAEPERANMLGQARHARCEEGLRRAARDTGQKAVVHHTRPAGGCYTLVSSSGVHLIRGNIQAHCGLPRPTKFRQELAALNAWLDPVQMDLFRQEAPRPPKDRLCGIIVVTAHRRYGDRSIPAFVGLGIPSSDLSEWVILEPIQKLLGRYHDLETNIHTPDEAPITVKDRAVPRLKKALNGDPTN